MSCASARRAYFFVFACTTPVPGFTPTSCDDFVAPPCFVLSCTAADESGDDVVKPFARTVELDDDDFERDDAGFTLTVFFGFAPACARGATRTTIANTDAAQSFFIPRFYQPGATAKICGG